jgi:DNA recombination protein RmuC
MDFAVIILGMALVIAAAILGFALTRPKTAHPEPPKSDPRLDAVISGQGAITEQFRQAVAAQTLLSQQVDALKEKLGESLAANAEKTGQTLGSLTERLNVIDSAQKNITDLSTHVSSLREIFSDKQARGAFGQERMEAIISDQLSPDQYEFQASLSNGSRPDCAIRIPNVAARIVVDSKFPLEAFEALRLSTTDEERKSATTRLRADMQKHIKDIAEKYLIPGETQTPAILFVPSESIYAELHINFAELLQRARQMQVVVVSPHVFMLVVGTIQSLMRDARMREQAHEIQKAVAGLLTDVRRLSERIGDLRKHFETTNKDIGQIEISIKAIDRNAEKISQVELAPPENAKSLS